jgi:hypothetical protein
MNVRLQPIREGMRWIKSSQGVGSELSLTGALTWVVIVWYARVWCGRTGPGRYVEARLFRKVLVLASRVSVAEISSRNTGRVLVLGKLDLTECERNAKEIA